MGAQGKVGSNMKRAVVGVEEKEKACWTAPSPNLQQRAMQPQLLGKEERRPKFEWAAWGLAGCAWSLFGH
jgi:hypothetical protein